MRLELIPPGTVASQTIAPAPTPEKIEIRNPRFEIAPAGAPSSGSKVIAGSSEMRATEQEPPPPEPARQPPAKPSPTTPTASNPHTPASKSGSQNTLAEVQPKEALTQITESPTEQDPYLVRLAVHLGRELEKLRVPAISRLDQTARMEIQLQLLDNGALTRSRILKSTGIEGIDDAAYRASLAASPYPEPPTDKENQNRFEVELVFSPKRL
ncbi:energy transducer TonB family protein [Marinobacter salinus]|nr:energy transducer TonB [Marinobacter salinus]